MKNSAEATAMVEKNNTRIPSVDAGILFRNSIYDTWKIGYYLRLFLSNTPEGSILFTPELRNERKQPIEV